MKYKIYFADLTHTGIGINANCFPLGIGLVAANTARELKKEIDLSIYKFPENLNDAIKKEPPHILCLSNYAWNLNLSYLFAKYIKKVDPNIVVISGGPNFPIDKEERQSFLKCHNAIDFYIKWDGELAFIELAKKLIEGNLNVSRFKESKMVLDNVCYVIGDDYVEGQDQRVVDLMSIPSPYLTGLFDKYFDYPLIPLIETTRGCPYSCTFCNDGHITRNKIFRRDNDYIRDELQYIASRSKNSDQLSISDLNFGMYKEDIVTSLTIRDIIKKYKWPNRIDTAIGKSHPERIIEVTGNINSGNKGIFKLGQSFQSTDKVIMGNIKRKNLKMDALLSMKDYNLDINNDKSVFFSELILALPGDNLKKHYKSLQDVIDVLKMNNVDIHQLTLLKGSWMATKQQRIKYSPQTKYRVFVGCLGIYDVGAEIEPCAEIEEVVVGNKTMSFEEYLECRKMNLLVKIYTDHDPFKEIFSLMRKFDFSIFSLLRLLKENIVKKYKSLSSLLDSFVEGTKKPFFEDYDTIIQFTHNIENMKRYISGEYGQNELLTHRAKAYIECGDDIHAAVKDAAISYFQKNNLLDSDIQNYIEEAVEFSKLRKFDLNKLNSEKEGYFTYDFIESGKFGYEYDPVKYRIEKTKFRFFHSTEDLKIIQNLMNRWGTETLHQIGKLFQKNNLLLMDRQATKIILSRK
jgi:hypothetical protein